MIDRCVCHRRLFSDLKEVADKHQCKSVQALRAQVEFGTSCGLCNVYVDDMLKSGRVVFSDILLEDDDAEFF